MQFLPFAGLAGALVLLLLSTRQFRLALRLLIWIAGAGMLAASVWFALADSQAHSLIRTALAHPYALLAAFEGNWQAVGAAFSPLLDVLCIASVIVALVCLIAFTPGDVTERAIRPIAIGLVGAIMGSTIALAVVGIGFGGATKRQVYVGVVDADDIHDGDTILMGDTALRLWGIDAPELDQVCYLQREQPCGLAAKDHLERLIADQLIVCTKPNAAEGAPRESFGRPLVTCVRQSDKRDVGREMVRVGCAAAFRDKEKVKSNYRAEEAAANALSDSNRACPAFIQPGLWRGQN